MNLMRWHVLLFACLLAGCGEKTPESPPETTASPQSSPQAPAGVPSEDLSLLQKEYETTKADYQKNPTKENAQRYVDATVGYANAVMYSNAAPKEKYPKALRLYEEALKVDPENKTAQENRKLILDIYESLGKKPPEGGK